MAILASNIMSASRKWNCLAVCEQESFRRADARRLDSCDKHRNEDGKVSANLLSKRYDAKGNSAFASRHKEHSASEGCQAYPQFPHSCACHRNPATRSPSRERTFHIRQSEPTTFKPTKAPRRPSPISVCENTKPRAPSNPARNRRASFRSDPIAASQPRSPPALSRAKSSASGRK